MPKTTQKNKILHYLKLGGALTSIDAWRWFGCSRLAALIFDLKKAGHDITSNTTSVIVRDGSVAHVSIYRMMENGR